MKLYIVDNLCTFVLNQYYKKKLHNFVKNEFKMIS